MSLMWQQEDWRKQGACLAADPDLFFPMSTRGSSSAQVNRAKAICTGCSVRTKCFDFALAQSDVLGIWGGTTDDERRKLRRNRTAAARRQRTAA
jgi:WhiB family transcriptional regulator, redox-sensing transcriptional regulator